MKQSNWVTNQGFYALLRIKTNMQFREMRKPSYLPTRVRFREGGLESLPDALKKRGSKKALLVTGEGSMRKAGVTQRIEEMSKE